MLNTVKFKWITLFVAAAVISFVGSSVSAHDPDQGTQLKEELEILEQQHAQTSSDLETTEIELHDVKDDIEFMQLVLRQLDELMIETREQIEVEQLKLSLTKGFIEKQEEVITDLDKEILRREELIRERAREVQQGAGSVRYLNVLLGSSDFGDFINRLRSVRVIAEQDQFIIDQQIRDLELSESGKAELQQMEEILKEQEDELHMLESMLQDQASQREDILQDLEEQEVNLKEKMMSLTEQEENLISQQKIAENALQQWEAEEAKRQERLRKQDGGGTLARPATGRITSGYGPRWGRFHHGIDFGGGGRDDVPIRAAESGTVVEARYMNGYGNTIMISHVVDGRLMTTLYAHLDTMAVSPGQRVNRNDEIGKMGNTGVSTGKHLHFEVHEGYWNAEKSNSKDPMNYIN